MNRSAEEQVLGVGPLDATQKDGASTGILVALTLLLLLTLLALSIARGSALRAGDTVNHTMQVKLTVARARVAVDEGHMDQAQDLFIKLQDLTSDDARQQARAKTLLEKGTDERALRLQLDIMNDEEEAELALEVQDSVSKRKIVGLVLLFVMAFALAFAGAAMFIVRRGRRELIEQTAMLGSILDSIGDSVVAVDRDGKCVIVNAAFRRMFAVGFGQGKVNIDEALRNGMRKTDGGALEFEAGPFGKALRGEAIDNFDVSLHTDPKDPRVLLSATGRPVKNDRREIYSGVVVLRDVTQERIDRELLVQQASELQTQSLSDELTGLYNRRGFMLLSNQYSRTAARQKRPFAILFCDLNGLKQINDTYGHEAGDDAIARMANVLKVTFRESDIVARLGGDEYVALIDGADEVVTEKIISRMREEMDIDAKNHTTPYRLFTSTGAAYQMTGGSQTIEELLTFADERMYEEKKLSKESREARARAAVEHEKAEREAKAREALAKARAKPKVPPPSGRMPAVPRPTPREK